MLVRCSTRRSQRLGVAVELEPALRPAGVVLAVGAVVARVRPQPARAAPRPRAVVARPAPGRACAARRRRREVVGARRAATEARSRRICGLRALKLAREPEPGQWPSPASGSPPRSAAAPAARRSAPAAAARPATCRGSRTTANPANLPPGTSITSPRWSCASECEHLLAAVGPAGPRGTLLQLGDPLAERGVLHEVAAVAGRRLGVPLRARPGSCVSCRASPTTALSAWNWANDISSSSRARSPADLVHEVDRHVVRRAEARAERVGTRRGQAGDLARVHPRLPQHDARAPRRRGRGARRGRSAGCTPPA